jgi:hypothetical protein
MDGLTTATVQRMRGDATLAGMLATYRGVPPIFADDRVPEDAPFPRIVTAGNVADEPDDTKTDQARNVTRDIYCYTDHQRTDDIEPIADRVSVLFHRYRGLVIPGWYVWRARVHGPVATSSGDYDGRVLTVRWAIARQEQP